MPDLLTTRQLMDLLQLDRTTIYRMVNDGRLPALRVGGQWRFSRQAVEAIIAKNRPVSPAGSPAEAESYTAPRVTTDVLPLHCLQPIQEVFAQTAGIGAVTTSTSGEPIIAFSNPCQFCSLILATEEGRSRCQASWRRLADEDENNPRLERCHAGLTYARGWIKVGNQPIAMFFGGQFKVDGARSIDMAQSIERLARDCKLDPEALGQASEKVRTLSKERAAQLLQLLQMVADTFSTIGQERQDMLHRLERVAEIASGAAA